MPTISIIVPIYNVEKYLSRCIESIFAQSFVDFELILVDDGSSDRSGELCDEYAAKDSRIVVLHQENSGQAAARNKALDIAKGDYIAFVDSDDRIHPQYLEVLYQNVIEAGADISICSYQKENEGELLADEAICDDRNIWNGRDFLRHSVLDSIGKHWLLWDKLFAKKCFDNARLPEGRIFEDNATVYKLIYKADMVVDCDCKLYYYFQRAGSTVNQTFRLKQLDYLTVCEEMIDFFAQHDEEDMKRHMEKSYFHEMVRLYPAVCSMKPPNKEAKSQIKHKLLSQKKVIEGYEPVCIKTYPRYYEVMYPRLMKVYWTFKGLLGKFTK